MPVTAVFSQAGGRCLQADINKSADEFEEQLCASRERMEADQAAFAAWEHERGSSTVFAF